MNQKQKLDIWSHFETTKPQNRVVLLGASNLTRSFPTVVGTSLSSFKRPLSIYSAMGCGRSYGQVSQFFLKKISGISQSKIWHELSRDIHTPTTAFVTDIGNDLAYEVPVDVVLGWVETCLDQLQSLSAKVVLSDLPMIALREVGNVRYRLFRTLLFPYCTLSWNEMLKRAQQLSDRLQHLAKSRNIPIFIGEKEWYALDPIHPRKSSHALYWHNFFALADVTPSPSRLLEHQPLLRWYLRGLRPENWSYFSISRHAQQPQAQLHDGTTISLY